VPDSGQHNLLAVRQVGEEFLRHDLRRRGEVELPSDQEGLHIRPSHLTPEDHSQDLVTEVGGRFEHERASTVDHGDAVLPPAGPWACR
jgi:hypothetical protein